MENGDRTYGFGLLYYTGDYLARVKNFQYADMYGDYSLCECCPWFYGFAYLYYGRVLS